MKVVEKERARALRKKGWSLRAITQEICCSKSSVSRWIQDIHLTSQQILSLKSNQDQGRAKAANHPNSPKNKWAKFRGNIAKLKEKEIPSKPSPSLLKFIAVALYWAEGYKLGRNLFVFVNGDPDMIRIMMQFLRSVCRVPEIKFRGRVHIHPELDSKKTQRYWVKVSGIPLTQFHKPQLTIPKSSQQKRKTLPYGTFRIIISDVVLCSQIQGWISGMRQWAISSVG